MRQRCETCEYFKYVESNVYGRCQNKTEESVLEGIPRVPWATACEFFQNSKVPDKNDLNEEHMRQDIIQKQTNADGITTAHCTAAPKTDCSKL